MNQTDIYGILYPTTEEYTFFTSTNGMFSRIHYVLGQKQILTNVKVGSTPKVSFLNPMVGKSKSITRRKLENS